MTLDKTSDNPIDPLSEATTALRQTPIAVGPSAEMLARAEQIPFNHQGWRVTKYHAMLVAACVTLVLFAAFAYFLLQHSATIAFADVVQTIDQTHTFTATVEADNVPTIHLWAKGSKLRIQAEDSIQIVDPMAGKVLQLVPSIRKAVEAPIHQMPFDLYQMIRNYHAGDGKPLGEELINGQKVQGFMVRIAPPGGAQSMPCEMWIDPQKKLPVRLEIGPVVMSDLHFDVPLDDALFDTTVPAGYSLSAPDKMKGEQLSFAGQVMDQRGKPIADVQVAATYRLDPFSPGGYGCLAQPVDTDKDGRFSITSHSHVSADDAPVRLEFIHPDFLYARLEDLRLLPAEKRTHLQVMLRDGSSVTGKITDPAGLPIAGATVEAVYGQIVFGKPRDDSVRYDYSKIVSTDVNGKFTLRGIATEPVVLQIMKTGPGTPLQSAQVDMDLRLPPKATPLTIVVRPFELPPTKAVHELFGMKLVDVDDDMRAALSLNPSDRVMVLDPGTDSSRLNVGELEPLDSFWMVGETRIKDFDDFTRHLLAACELQHQKGHTEFLVRVVYNYSRERGSNTQYMSLTADDFDELKKIVKP